MKLLQNKIYLSYTTTEQSKININKLQQSFSEFILTVIDYYRLKNLKFTKFDPELFLLEDTFKPRLTKFLSLSIEYYFHLLVNGINLEKVKSLVASDVTIAFRRKDCVIYTENTYSVVLIPDVNIILSVDFDFKNYSLSELHICKNKIILGD